MLQTVKEVSPETVVIMITAFATTETAVEAMKLGAYDYITKPFKVDEIKLIIQKALEKRSSAERKIFFSSGRSSRGPGFENFIGKSEPMQKVFCSDPAGCGHEQHGADYRRERDGQGTGGPGHSLQQSRRKDKPFVTVNCGALPETLLESELFGYMKGAFTGATSNKQGLFEAANGGTIFLDEISATTPALQIKLLRVLQEREFMRVGGTTDIKVDVRVIAASNKDLLDEVCEGYVPGGPLLPPERDPDPPAAASGTEGRYSAPGRIFS